jgi:hypothetical protein
MKNESIATFFHVEVLQTKGGGWRHIAVFNSVRFPAQNRFPTSFVVGEGT